MHFHLWFDLLSYLVGGIVAYVLKKNSSKQPNLSHGYYISLLSGVTIGAFTFGSLNIVNYSGDFTVGKSVIGALFGGIVFVETYKRIAGLKFSSTGAFFVPSLAIGIGIGRIGCFLGGLEDYTYGIETDSIFGYDFGDGIMRHPVQLYESIAMCLFFIYSLWLFRIKYIIFKQRVFYYFVAFYSIQRFAWELLKPYPTVAFGLNIFQILCVLMLSYALLYLYLLRKANR